MAAYRWAIVVAATLLAAGAQAAAYQPGEVFRLDLNSAALSPRPLGPPAQFEPVPVQAKEEVTPAPPAVAKPVRAAAKPRPTAGKRIVRRNPLDANAADTRIQVWPCRSGGICQWRK